MNNATTTTQVTTKEVTVKELAVILANIEVIGNMSNIAFVDQLTEPKCTKKDRDTKEAFLGQIHKASKVSIILNTDYETAIENKKVKEIAEGKEVSEYQKGKNTMPVDKSESKNNFFGYFTDKQGNKKPVLEYRPNPNGTPKVAYYLNGKLTDKANLPNVLPTSYKATNQGTNDEIVWRKLYLKGIEKISLNGTTYVVIK